MRRPCTNCGGWFEPSKPFHRQCWDCWHEAHDEDPPRPRAVGREVVSPLDSVTLRGAIALVHPDRHPPERQEEATAITAKLLAALEVVRSTERSAAA
jgi:hypothetical protein